MSPAPDSPGLDMALVRSQWAPPSDGSIYLNSGSCGRKPEAVLTAIAQGWRQLNLNPTLYSFTDDLSKQARAAVAQLLGVDSGNLLLTQNTTQGIQLVLQSFLLKPGDELVTSTHEHGSLRTIARYLEETRGVVVKRYDVEPLDGSQCLQDGLFKLVSERTCLVQISEIDPYSGWRPQLEQLAARLKEMNVPLLVDGAHALGQGPSKAGSYPMWVGSCHKWLGAPNGTGILHVAADLEPRLKPVWLSDRFYNQAEHPLGRFEFQGTGDVVRWLGLVAACRLQMELGPTNVADRQAQLVTHLRRRLAELPGTCVRTPSVPGETSGMLTVRWRPSNVKVANLKEWLWDTHHVWTQPDLLYGDPGHGLRISCHISTSEQELDALIDALKQVISA